MKEKKEKGSKEKMFPNVVIMLPPSVGGIMGEVFLADIIDMLVPLSKKIYVISTMKPTTNPEQKIHVVQMRGYGQEEPLVAKGAKFLFIQLKACFHLLRISRDIDVVMFPTGSGLYLLPLIVARLLGARTTFSATALYSQMAVHRYQKHLLGLGGSLLPFIFRIAERVTFCVAQRILVQSETAINFLGLNKYRKKISVVPSRIIDTDRFSVQRDLHKRDLVGYIGRLGGEKGVMNLTRALPLVSEKKDDVRYLIGGDGPLLHEVKRELKMSGIYDKVTFTGWIPHSEMAGYLNMLKLFILPSHTEGLPGTVLEAMACGTPVLATPVGAIPDIIKNGETGFIMEDNSPECITENIVRALNDSNLEQITRNARALVEKEFTCEAAVEKYRSVLASLIK